MHGYNDGVYGDTAEFSWSSKSAGFGHQQGLDCCPVDGHRASQQKWYMITYTLTKEIVDNETIFKFRGYYNGKLLSTERTYNYWGRSIPSLGTKLYLGVANQINSTPNHHFKGTLDDVRIYKGALTPDEVSDLYEKEKLGLGEEEVNSITLMLEVYLQQSTCTLLMTPNLMKAPRH